MNFRTLQVTGLQAALGQLGRCPRYLGTDNTSAATHDLEQMPGRPRAYNSDYLELCTHYDLTPLTINIACPHEHGDVESQNRHLKRSLEQHLILRGRPTPAWSRCCPAFLNRCAS